VALSGEAAYLRAFCRRMIMNSAINERMIRVVKKGNIETVEKSLESGADVACEDGHGRTPPSSPTPEELRRSPFEAFDPRIRRTTVDFSPGIVRFFAATALIGP